VIGQLDDPHNQATSHLNTKTTAQAAAGRQWAEISSRHILAIPPRRRHRNPPGSQYHPGQRPHCLLPADRSQKLAEQNAALRRKRDHTVRGQTGAPAQAPVEQLEPHERARLLVRAAGCRLEPACLWLGEHGMPITVSGAEAVFASANEPG
jgi:hypothetical protein